MRHANEIIRFIREPIGNYIYIVENKTTRELYWKSFIDSLIDGEKIHKLLGIYPKVIDVKFVKGKFIKCWEVKTVMVSEHEYCLVRVKGGK